MCSRAQDRSGITEIIWLMRVYAFHRPVTRVGLARFAVIAPLSMLAAFVVSFQASKVVKFHILRFLGMLTETLAAAKHQRNLGHSLATSFGIMQ